MSTADEKILPWYREFWFWFVFGPLIFIIVLCAFTVTIALRNADDVIVDNYYKEGLMINQVLEQDKRAQALGLSARLRFDITTGEVILSLVNAPDDLSLQPAKMILFMANPVKAAKDHQILLTKISSGEYRGELVKAPEFSWYLTLFPVADMKERDSAPWILNGAIDFVQGQETILKPRDK